jgi:hypothetical protein
MKMNRAMGLHHNQLEKTQTRKILTRLWNAFHGTHGTLTSADFRYWPSPPGCVGGVAGAGCPPAGAGVAGAAGTGTEGGFAGCGVGDGCAGLGVAGAPGSVVNGPSVPGVSGPDVRDAFATSANAIDVAMKIDASTTVVRVSTFAVPRPVIRPPTPPPVPRPKPPPSERCKRMTPIIAAQTMSWMVNKMGNTADMGGFGSQFRKAHQSAGSRGL